MDMKHLTIRKFTLSAMFIALGLVLPFFTGQIPQIGNMLLPMHIPVFLCGLICGWRYGGAVGLILPIMRHMLFGMPVLFPTGLAMSAELMTYGVTAGLLYGMSKWQCVRSLYRAVITAMLAGRLGWGVVSAILLGLGGKGFTWQMVMAGAFVNAVPGIIIQLILIPAIMVALNRTKLVPFKKKNAETEVSLSA